MTEGKPRALAQAGLTGRACAAATACAVALLLMLAQDGAAARTAATSAARVARVARVASAVSAARVASAASADVGAATVGPPIKAGFVGIATDYWDITDYAGTSPANPDTPFEQTLRNLAPAGGFNLRIGGDSTDWTWWPIPGTKQPVWVRWSMSPGWLAVTRRLATDVGASMMFGINLEADSARISAAEISAISAGMGSTVPLTFELGNEPELYAHFPFYKTAQGQFVRGRTSSYGPTEITADWNQLAARLPVKSFAGPGFPSLRMLPFEGQFVAASHHLSLVTLHTYALRPQFCQKGGSVQEAQLFTPAALQDLAGGVASFVRISERHSIGVRVDEINSVTCGGLKYFSGTFGPALWALNILPLYAQAGITGVNFETRPNTAQELIEPTHTGRSWTVAVQPEYYGMLAFAELTPAGSKFMRVSGLPTGLLGWADQTPQGQTNVVITNPHAAAATVAVRLPGATGPATVRSLSDKSGRLDAFGGVSLGGQTISPRTGQLAGAAVATTVPQSPTGAYPVTVGPNSAAILTVGGSAG